MHWHVDYLRPLADQTRPFAVAGVERRECVLAAALARLPGARLAVFGFGGAGYRCPGHLVCFGAAPDNAILALGLWPWPWPFGD